MRLDRIVCGRRDSNSHGLPPAPLSQSAGDQRPADPKSAAYAYSATPALYVKVDAHSTIGHNQRAYRAVCKQGPGGESALKTNPLRGLGLGGLHRLGLSHSGTSYPLPALRLTASRAACTSGPGRYSRPPSARRLEWSYTLARLNPSGLRMASTSKRRRPMPRGLQPSDCAIADDWTPSLCATISSRKSTVERRASYVLPWAALRPLLPFRSGVSSTRSSAASRRAASSSDWKVTSRPAIFILKIAMGCDDTRKMACATTLRPT